MTADEIVALCKRHTLFEWSAQEDVNPIPVVRAKGVYFWDAKTCGSAAAMANWWRRGSSTPAYRLPEHIRSRHFEVILIALPDETPAGVPGWR